MKKMITITFLIVFFIFFIILIYADDEPPKWMNNITNATSTTPQYNDTIQMNVTLTDNVSLSHYIFSWNCTPDGWLNDSVEYVDGWCYQETANESTTCGGLSSGKFDSPSNYTNAIDGNWSTYVSSPFNMTINYTKPNMNLNISIWQVYYGESRYNITINSSCDQDPIQLRVNVPLQPKSAHYYQCWNDTDWLTLHSVSSTQFYDEAMYWNMSNKTVVSVSKKVNATNHPICGYTVYFNDTSNNWNQTDIFLINVINTLPEQPTLNYPSDQYIVSTNYTWLNYSSTDVDNDTITYYIYSDTNTNPITLVYNGTATGFNYSGFIDNSTYYWKVKAGDGTDNTSNSSIRSFTVSLTSPAINLDSYENNTYESTTTNIYINFTATDPNGISACSLYGNWSSAGWHNNQTISSITSGTSTNFSVIGLDNEKQYLYNIWCNDTSGAEGFYSLGNVTIGVDTSNPNSSIDNPLNGTTENTQTITVQHTVRDGLLNNCSIRVYQTALGYGVAEPGYNNLSITCNEDYTINVTAWTDYTLHLYAYDKASNLNDTSVEFTTEQSTGSSGGGGGGAPVIQKIELPTPSELTAEEIEGLCGNGICEPEVGETPWTCFNDCFAEIWELDQIFCLPLFNCGNWTEAWFMNIMVLTTIGGFGYFQYRTKKTRRKI